MKLIAKLTLRSLMKNRWRSLATMAAIFLSTLMLVCVTILASSAMNGLKQREIAASGNWHVVYQGVDAQGVDLICEDTRTAAAAITQGVGYLKPEKTYHARRPYFYVTAVDEAGFALRPYKLIEGRLPKDENEVLLPKSLTLIESFDLQINDTFTAAYGMRIDNELGETLYQNYSYDAADEHFSTIGSKHYTIVGIYDDMYGSNSASAGFDLICGLTAPQAGTSYDVYVQDALLEDSLYSHSEALMEESGADAVDYNRYLLLYEGIAGDSDLVVMLKLLAAVCSTLIVISSIIVIHNSFSISLSQRSRYLGMLSSVGATRRQKRQSVFWEACFLSLPAILIAVFAAMGVCALAMQGINALLADAVNLSLSFAIDPSLFAMAILLSFATVLFSAWMPARHAAQIPAISAIRQNGDITLPQHRTRTPFLIKRCFGFAAAMGIKNQKRFRARYYAVLGSMTLSFVLFVSIFSLTSYLEQAISMMRLETPFDIEVSYNRGEAGQSGDTDALLQLSNAQESLRIQRTYLSLEDASVFSDELRAYLDEQYLGGLGVELLALDDASFTQLCRQNNIDPKTIAEQSAIAVNIGKQQTGFADHTFAKLQYLPWDVKTLSVKSYDSDPFSLPIAAMIEEPYALDIYGGSRLDTISLYVRESYLAQICAQVGEVPSVELYYTTADPTALQGEIEDYVQTQGDMTLYTSIANIDQGVNKTHSLISLIQLLLYTFLLLISCVALTNVCNTLSGSFTQRSQEHAMLISLGMDQRQMRRMLTFETLSYAFQSAILGVLFAVPLCYAIYQIMGMKFTFAFYVPLVPLLLGFGMLVVISLLMLAYHLALSKKESVIETIRRESI